MWSSTVGLVNGKYRYLTAETFGFKINSNGQQLKRRQQWTIEPFPENLGPDGSISSAASVSSLCQDPHQISDSPQQQCILTLGPGPICASLSSAKSSNGSSTASDQDTSGEEHENVAIKSHLNKYLAVDSFGNVTCDSEEKTENARFTITICSMSQGKSKDEHIFWAFKNVERGYYLGTTEDGMICCNAKIPNSRAELWHLHLIPARGASFFTIKSLGRKRFARVAIEDENPIIKNQQDNSAIQVQLDATISWGPETLFQFKYYEGGRYSLMTSDYKHLTNEGKCIKWKGDETTLPPPECLFTLEYHSGFLAFRDSFGHYLAAAGRSSVLRSRSIGVSRDELFVFECAPIQISLKATFNNRWVSIKQGVDLSANQTETTTKYETFQLTYHKQTQNWSIMTQDCNFWTVSNNTNTIAICRPGDYEGLTRGQFKLIWSDSDATCSLKYVDPSRQERWIAARKSGQLFLGTGAQEPVKFIMRFQNRRSLNLRPVDGNGFVGLRGGNSKQIEANKTAPDSIAIEYSELVSATLNASNGTIAENSLKKTLVGGENPTKLISNNDEQRTINVFNVRLNSTKNGQSVLGRFQNNNSTAKSKQPDEEQSSGTLVVMNQKEIDYGIDDNNNNCITPSETDNNNNNNNKVNGSVESSSTPSVASIINSFSNTRLTNNTLNEQQQQTSTNSTKQLGNRLGTSVSKLASSFESNSSTVQSTYNNQNESSSSDSGSVITSFSTASVSSSSNGSGGGTLNTISENHVGINTNNAQAQQKGSLADQVAQSECCFMRIISNDKYLVVGDTNESSIICDATNKACAQPWILELRSHNSIAIRASDNHAYMQLGTNGTIFLSRCDPKDASLWEF